MEIPVSKPYQSPKIALYVNKALKRNEIARGYFEGLFEAKFAQITGFKEAVAVSNGTMGLFVALRALGVENGEVIIPSLTFAGTIDAVLMAGAKPVFADCEDDGNISVNTASGLINKKTKAIITVGLYGRVPNSREINKLGVPVIEDACETLGVRSHGADITVYSFFGNKLITTGEGGMCVTDYPDLALKMRKLRNHGRLEGYWHELRGTNARLANINCAIGLAQLESLPEILEQRYKIWEWYGKEREQGVAPWLMAWYVKGNKEKAVEKLKRAGIESRPGFYPLHKLPAYKQKISLPNTERLGKHTILLPLFPGLTKKQVTFILKHANNL